MADGADVGADGTGGAWHAGVSVHFYITYVTQGEAPAPLYQMDTRDFDNESE